MQSKSIRIRELIAETKLIPVLVIDSDDYAEPLATALLAGGLSVLEVTMRTEAALASIATMADVKGVVVGAGTVLNAEQAVQAKDAGAKFAVSPGASATLIDICDKIELPLLPGAATASEIMTLLEYGYDLQKFFPSEAMGGIATLKAYASPFSGVQFCPTGGVTVQSAPDYLGLGNVLCVGGSWVAPKSDMMAGNWDKISELAANSCDTLTVT